MTLEDLYFVIASFKVFLDIFKIPLSSSCVGLRFWFAPFCANDCGEHAEVLMVENDRGTGGWARAVEKASLCDTGY